MIVPNCPKCGEEFRLAWIMGDPPEPYGDVCGCPDEEYLWAVEDKVADAREHSSPRQVEREDSRDEPSPPNPSTEG